jgi:hypothetical protein
MARARIGPDGPDIFTACRHLDGWAVRHEGTYSDLSGSREEAMAAANRLARATTTLGRPSRVTVSDEPGFLPVPFADPRPVARHGATEV